jgi:hypothetical protein
MDVLLLYILSLPIWRGNMTEQRYPSDTNIIFDTTANFEDTLPSPSPMPTYLTYYELPIWRGNMTEQRYPSDTNIIFDTTANLKDTLPSPSPMPTYFTYYEGGSDEFYSQLFKSYMKGVVLRGSLS